MPIRGREEKDQSVFLEVVAFDGLAEAIADGLRPEKGALVYVEGRLQAETYETKEGEKRTRITLLVNNLALLAKTRKHQEAEASGEAKEVEETEDEEAFF